MDGMGEEDGGDEAKGGGERGQFQRALKFGAKVRLLRGKVCWKIQQNTTIKKSLPFRGPRKSLILG